MLTIKAHAKLNLFLNVLERRGDGYHNIQTILQTISLADRLRFASTDEETAVIYENIPASDFKGDLVAEAAAVIRQKTGLTRHTRIEVLKKTPVGAGLGGGSSDAAATLVGLNMLHSLGLNHAQLLELAALIGADVPFFIDGGTQLAQERGERLTALGNMPACWIIIATPPARISTSRAYEDYDRSDAQSHEKPAAMIDAIRDRDFKSICATLYNRFEAVIEPQYPEIGELKEKARTAGAEGTLMSGSGSSVFALTSSEQAAQRIGQAWDYGGNCVSLATPCQSGWQTIE